MAKSRDRYSKDDASIAHKRNSEDRLRGRRGVRARARGARINKIAMANVDRALSMLYDEQPSGGEITNS